ncbi:hypothetical protein [Sulfurimonas microaerophilic]|uniref:hypothetical protein n=1 Tax=Sulfurimonas microaerophilic TaxID=3058392 RepID=UPI002714E0D0|nr:hypothetical protein [Sulfurimonas sp. hsl 1-7]
MITTSLSLVGRAKASMMKINENSMPLSKLRINFNLKSLINILKIWLFIIPLFTLDAKEPTMMMLKRAVNNSLQEFQIAPYYSFVCRPYGVVTIDEVLNSKKIDKECKETLQKFYIQNPKLYHLNRRYLKRKSFYHVEYVDKSCIVYAKGEFTFSEILLQEGLALTKKSLQSEVFKARFESTQKSAETWKRGAFSDPKVLSCMKRYY